MADKYQDRRDAKAAAYRSPVNPFPEGSRLHRYFISARKHHDQMEDAFRDLETVYGTIGTRRASTLVPHDGSTTSVVKESLTTADTTQEKT